jgi:hypothetical protein
LDAGIENTCRGATFLIGDPVQPNRRGAHERQAASESRDDRAPAA